MCLECGQDHDERTAAHRRFSSANATSSSPSLLNSMAKRIGRTTIGSRPTPYTSMATGSGNPRNNAAPGDTTGRKNGAPKPTKITVKRNDAAATTRAGRICEFAVPIAVAADMQRAEPAIIDQVPHGAAPNHAEA